MCSHQDTEVFFLAAPNNLELAKICRKYTEIAKHISLAELADFSRESARAVNLDHTTRGAIVAGNQKELCQRLEQLGTLAMATEQVANHVVQTPLREIWLGNRQAKPRIGFFFPGQGAQKLNMGRTLAKRYPFALRAISLCDTLVGEVNGQRLSDALYHSTDGVDEKTHRQWSKELVDTRLAQPAIALTSLLWAKRLAQLGCLPDVVAGHSMGEVTAFHLAGLDIPKDLLSQYLALRGSFLTDVIKSDLQHMAPLTTEDGKKATEAETAIEVAAKDNSNTERAPQDHGADLQAEIVTRTLELISERTGFPKEILDVNMHLLNDLNMESIKAGELILHLARDFDVAGMIDPAPLTQMNIQELASAIATIRRKSTGAVGMSGSKQLLRQLEESSGVKTWVRNFIMRAIPLKLQDIDKKVLPQSGEKFLILHSEGDGELAESVAKKFRLLGYEIVISTCGAELTAGQDLALLIGILPRSPGTGFGGQQLTGAVRQLHTLSQAATAILRGKSAGQPSLLTVQFTDGKFGLDSPPGSPAQAGSISFAASIHHENPRLQVRTLDFSAKLSDDDISNCIVSEIFGPEKYKLVGYDADLTRYIFQPELQAAGRYSPRNITWNNADVIVVTGGAKGVTAQCALALARKTAAKMALIGSSLPPVQDESSENNEIAQLLDLYAGAGLTAQYYQCNVTDEASVKETILQIEQDLGPVTGVIHGAGINKPKVVHEVALADAQQEIAPKILGALHLCQALAAKPPKLFIGFSSIIGITGMPGNAWYAYANEILDRVLRGFHFDHPETQILSIAYSVWEEIGMGARLGSVDMLASLGISAIPVKEGIERFIDLWLHDPLEKQVIVTARLGSLDTFNIPRRPEPDAKTFLENIEIHIPGVEVVARVGLHPDRHHFLLDHNYEGSLLLPAVFGLEAMAQAAAFVVGMSRLDSLRIKNIFLIGRSSLTPAVERQFGFTPWSTRPVKKTFSIGSMSVFPPRTAAFTPATSVVLWK